MSLTVYLHPPADPRAIANAGTDGIAQISKPSSAPNPVCSSLWDLPSRSTTKNSTRLSNCQEAASWYGDEEKRLSDTVVVLERRGETDDGWQTLVSEYNSLGNDRYFDTASQTSFEVDHAAQVRPPPSPHPPTP
jgi:hypothetical protein